MRALRPVTMPVTQEPGQPDAGSTIRQDHQRRDHAPATEAPNLAWTFPRRHLERMTIGTVFDVGVSKGTRELYAAFPDAYYVLVEPLRENLPDLDAILERHRGEYVLAAAGAESGRATLNVEPARRGMSSLLDRKSGTATGDEVERREVPVVTLDEISGSRDLPRPYGVKIDTEGFELEVVRGAGRTLRETVFVIAETSTRRRFDGGYRAIDLFAELRRHGFVPFDLLRSTKRFVDVLFMRP